MKNNVLEEMKQEFKHNKEMKRNVLAYEKEQETLKSIWND